MAASAFPRVFRLDYNQSNTDATSYATASVTPTNGRVAFAAIATYLSTGTPAIPTASGNGQTWIQLATVTVGSNLRLTVYYAVVASATAGAVTFDFGAETQTAAAWSYLEISLIDNAAPVVQSKTNTATGSSAISVTLDAALTSVWNIVLGWLAIQGGTNTDRPTDGFGTIDRTAAASDGCTILPVFGGGINPGRTGTPNANKVGVAVELKTASGGLLRHPGMAGGMAA
jgi:hypothetical protein